MRNVRKFLIEWCARRDCSRLRRESSASLRTAVALRAPSSNSAADGQVVELPASWFVVAQMIL
jgi:hypothetical protein